MALELEIKAVLDELGDPTEAAARLIPFVENSEGMFNPENVVGLCRFLLHAGLYAELIDFVLRHRKTEGFVIPWPYLLDAIALSRPSIDDGLAAVLLEGIDSQQARGEASRSKALDLLTPELKSERTDRRLRAIKNHRRDKEHLIEQLATLRTQQLYEQERRLLGRLQRLYPNDPEVLAEAREHRERYALEILARRGRVSKRTDFDNQPKDDALEEARRGLALSLHEAAERHPGMAIDFAILAAVLEMWETALSVLDHGFPSPAGNWLRLELLLGARRYLELLDEIPALESAYANEPETFFATAYMRAQALWGLGQKHQAIEILESLLAARPQYRAGPSLLAQWRGL